MTDIDYAEQLKKIRIRMAVSIVIYVVFALSSIAVIVTGSDDLTVYLLIPLVIATLTLPRFVLPPGFEVKVTAEEKPAAVALLATRRWLTVTRAIYLIAAIAILIGLPELLG